MTSNKKNLPSPKERKRKTVEQEAIAIQTPKRAKPRETLREDSEYKSAKKVVREVNKTLNREKPAVRSRKESICKTPAKEKALGPVCEKAVTQLTDTEKTKRKELKVKIIDNCGDHKQKLKRVLTHQQQSTTKHSNSVTKATTKVAKPSAKLRQRKETVSILKPLEKEVNKKGGDKISQKCSGELSPSEDVSVGSEGIKVQHKDTTIIIKEYDTFTKKKPVTPVDPVCESVPTTASTSVTHQTIKVECIEEIKPQEESFEVKKEEKEFTEVKQEPERQTVKLEAEFSCKQTVKLEVKSDSELLDKPTRFNPPTSKTRSLESSPTCSPLNPKPSKPVRVWRDPALLASEFEVRHITSAQHQIMQPHRSPSVPPSYQTESLHPSLNQQAHSSSLYSSLYTHPMSGLRPLTPLSGMLPAMPPGGTRMDSYQQIAAAHQQYQQYQQLMASYGLHSGMSQQVRTQLFTLLKELQTIIS